MQDGTKYPVFPGEGDLLCDQVALVSKHHPHGECDRQYILGPMKSQHDPLQPDAADSAALLQVSQVPPLGSEQWVGIGLAGRGWVLHLWLCSLPSNGVCQTSLTNAAWPL